LVKLEEDDVLQDKALALHHICTRTLSDTPALKIIENQFGVTYIKRLQQQVIDSK